MRTFRLPPAERDVLACVYRLPEATARQIRESLHSYRPMVHGSVLTLLKRLEAKRLLAEEEGPCGQGLCLSRHSTPEIHVHPLAR